MNKNIVVTTEMEKMGQEIACNIMDVQIIKLMNGIELFNSWIKEFKGENLDLILQCVDGEITSVAAIFMAMKRKEV